MKPVPHEAGKSSYALIDGAAFLEALPLFDVRVALDLGCGVGNYALPVARRLPPGARLQGIDLWEEGVSTLARAAAEQGLTNVTAAVGDLTDLGMVPDAQADLVLMATVVHDLVERGHAGAALAEAARVLRPGGCLAVVEFKKIPSKPGPPVAIRLSPNELAALVGPAGFRDPQTVDLGPSNYLSLFRRKALP
ncbi:MAG: class I SAM-dependent methyltransferase [Deferrisomatales bacterium]|nr:class I SAM-dependent methyltransferase [Deferrisomatales bacterium]